MEITAVHDKTSMVQYLGETMGFCNCGAGDEGIRFLYRILSLVQERTQTVSQEDSTQFKQISQNLRTELRIDVEPILASWFIHTLEHAGLLYHGFNILDLWCMSNGDQLLEVIKRCYLAEPSDKLNE
jgi:hypothetical protein